MKNYLKIIVIADTLDTSKSSGAKGRLELIKNLIACGYVLKVYHYSRKDIYIDQATVINIPEQRFSLYYLLSKIQIVFKRITGINLNVFTEKRRGFSYTFTSDVSSMKRALARENPAAFDWIIACSYAGSFRAHKTISLLPKWHSKFIAYVHDPYPDHKYPPPYDWEGPGHLQKEAFFKEMAQKARYLMYPSKYLSQWMDLQYGVTTGKAVIVPHQIPTNIVVKKVPDFFKESHFTLVHAGALMQTRNPLSLVHAFDEICNENESFRKESQLIFIGGRSIFHEEMEEIALKNQRIYIHSGYLDFEYVLPLQYKATVNIVLESTAAYSPFLPGKMPHCIFADTPILLLSPVKSETRRVLGYKYPYWSEADNTAVIKENMITLYTLWKKQEGSLTLNMPEVRDYFSREYLKEVFDNL